MTTAETPDITTVPKFDAVRARVRDEGVLSWLTKLQAWCEEAVAEQERAGKKLEQVADELEDVRQELVAKADVESLLERLDDTERGIFSMDETLDWIRRGDW